MHSTAIMESLTDVSMRARTFLAAEEFSLGVALVDHVTHQAPGSEVVAALRPFQNADGGFGHGLEVDISSPASNPFATRLAMIALLQVRDDAAGEMKASIQQWLEENQDDDGDWHLSPATRSGQLAPWFAAWEHPSLNPACCITGLANRLGIASPSMLAKTAHLFQAKAHLEQVANGSFYDLLPYSEYLTSVPDVPNLDAYLDAFASRVIGAADDVYEDASHFWDQILALGPPITRRLPSTLLDEWTARLLAEQQADGGWPTPYDPAWRSWTTTAAILHLAQLAK